MEQPLSAAAQYVDLNKPNVEACNVNIVNTDGIVRYSQPMRYLVSAYMKTVIIPSVIAALIIPLGGRFLLGQFGYSYATEALDIFFAVIVTALILSNAIGKLFIQINKQEATIIYRWKTHLFKSEERFNLHDYNHVTISGPHSYSQRYYAYQVTLSKRDADSPSMEMADGILMNIAGGSTMKILVNGDRQITQKVGKDIADYLAFTILDYSS